MNRVHPTALIGPEVRLGDDNVIGPFAVVLGPTTIGDGNWIGPHTAIGTPGEMRGGPHVAAWDGEIRGGGTVIGDRNVIREFVTVQAPDVGQTRIGNDCYIMTKAHVPHDGVLEDGVTVACAVLIGGHGRIGAKANLGLGAVLHQELVVGPGAMVGMGSVVTKHVAPYAIAYGSPAKVRGVNRVGMERSGVSADAIDALQQVYSTGDVGELPGGEPAELSAAFEWYRAALAD